MACKPPATLYYVHDPMCSWCWGFAPVLAELLNRLPSGIQVRRLLGGLAVDTDEPMSRGMQDMLQQTWHRIEQKIPGIHFNFDFWTNCQPRRSTYPSCRAVIAARQQGEGFDAQMTKAIQRAYYEQARNPSDDETLIELAVETGLDEAQFRQDLYSTDTQQQLLDEIELARELFAESFPALVFQQGNSNWRVPVDHLDSAPMLEMIDMHYETD